MTSAMRSGGDGFVEVSGSRLHYRWLRPELGGSPLIFLHEGLGSIELWRGFPDDVVNRTRHPGLVYSRHGNGWSEPLREPRHPDYMHREALETLPAVVEQLVGEPPLLIGHSDGASIAIIYAGAGHPVERLVLIAPHVFVEDRTLDSIGAFRSSFPESGMAERMAKYHTLPETTFLGWADVWLSPEFRRWNIEEHLAGVSCPSLLIQSEDDPYGSLDQLDAIESQVSGPVERLVVPGSDHAPQMSEPEQVTEATVRFIAGLEEGTG